MAFYTSNNESGLATPFQKTQLNLQSMFKHVSAARDSASEAVKSVAHDMSALGKAQLDTISKHAAAAGETASKVSRDVAGDLKTQGAVIAGGVAQAFSPATKAGLVVAQNLKTHGTVIAKGAVRTFDPITPYQRATPHVMGAKQEPSAQQRVAALFKGVTYKAPLTPTIERSPQDLNAIKIMNAQVGINGNAPGMFAVSQKAFSDFREIHKNSHHAIIGAFASIDRIARGEHDATAAQSSLQHLSNLITPPAGVQVPAQITDVAKIAASVLKEEMSGNRDIGNAVSATDIKNLNCGLEEMSVQIRHAARLEQEAFTKKLKTNLYSLRMLEHEKPKEPGKGLFSRIMRGFSNAADARYQRDIVAYDKRVATAKANIKAPPSKVAEYNEALAGVSGYYMHLASDLSAQLEPDEKKPSLQERVAQSVKYATEALPAMSISR